MVGVPSQRASDEVFCQYTFTVGEKSTEKVAAKGCAALRLPPLGTCHCCSTATKSTVGPPNLTDRELTQHLGGFQRAHW